MFLQDTQAGLLLVVMSCLCSCVILRLTLLSVCYIWRVLLCGHFVTSWVYFMSVCGSRVLYSLASLCGRFVGVACVYMSHRVPLCSCSVFLFHCFACLWCCFQTCYWSVPQCGLWLTCGGVFIHLQKLRSRRTLTHWYCCHVCFVHWRHPDKCCSLNSDICHFITIWYNLYIHIMILL